MGKIKKQNKQIEKRIHYVDVFRCIGILLMIGGHIGFGEPYSHWIHSFNMPMFFIVSGFFIQRSCEKRFLVFLLRLVRTLIIPYIIIGVLHYGVFLILHFCGILFGNNSIDIFSPLLSLLWINTSGMPIAGALWFLTALFFSELLYYVINKVREKIIRICLIIGVAILGNLWSYTGLGNLPYALDASFVGVGFLEIGNILNKFEKEKTKYNCLIVLFTSISLITIFSLLAFYNSRVGMNSGKYGNIALFWICATGISIGLWYFIKQITPVLERIMRSVFRFFVFIGENSIVFLCFNQIFIGVTKKLLIRMIGNTIFVAGFTFVLVVCEICILVKVMIKMKMMIIFGR